MNARPLTSSSSRGHREISVCGRSCARLRVCVFVCVCARVCPSLSFFPFLSLSLSLSLFLSVSLFLSLSFALSLSRCVSVSLCFCVSVSPCLCVSVSLCLCAGYLTSQKVACIYAPHLALSRGRVLQRYYLNIHVNIHTYTRKYIYIMF